LIIKDRFFIESVDDILRNSAKYPRGFSGKFAPGAVRPGAIETADVAPPPRRGTLNWLMMSRGEIQRRILRDIQHPGESLSRVF
jgi:hypothetical protein